MNVAATRSKGVMDKQDFTFTDDPAGDALLDLHFNESTFGLAEFSEVVDRRFAGRTGLRCLEVGSGSGMLLARLGDRFPQHSWEGIEPLGQGFSRFGSSLDLVESKFALKIHHTTFEDFETTERFDFIFSLNVVEHVDSWRDCLAKMHALLRPGGVAAVLCPNYSFPYEPHYALPVILTKDLTRRVFRRSIARYDAKNDTGELWTSLNFIKKRTVIAFCRERGIPLSFDETIMTRMVDKLWTDDAFAARQRVLGAPAKLLHRLGVTRLVEAFPLNLLSPYVKILLTK